MRHNIETIFTISNKINELFPLPVDRIHGKHQGAYEIKYGTCGTCRQKGLTSSLGQHSPNIDNKIKFDKKWIFELPYN